MEVGRDVRVSRMTWLEYRNKVLLVCGIVMLLAGWLGNHLVAAAPKPNGDREQRLVELESAAEGLYQSMQQGKTEAAHADMERVIQALEGLSFQGLTSVEGIHALAESIMDVRETLARVQVQSGEWETSSAKLRLAVNSLVHREKALWLQYYKVMADYLQSMEQARSKGDYNKVKSTMAALKQHYDVIRPAAVIQRSPSEINQFDSWISYLEGLTRQPQMDGEALKQVIPQGEFLLRNLFGRRGNEPVFLPVTGDNNPWYWTTMIGAWIILSLAYVGLRKFQGEQGVTPVRYSSSDDLPKYRW